MGKMRVRMMCDASDRSKTVTVLGHSDGATCANTNDAAILKKIAEQQVPGYGGGKIEELDKTSEYYERGSPTVAPLPPMSGDPNSFEDGETGFTEKKKGLGLGFGT